MGRNISDRIAPHNTKTRAAQKKLRKFQKRLKVGDELDARTDVNRTWYSGTVIEFRTNDQNVDEVKVRFNSHIVDSWVPRYGCICSTPHHTDKARNHLFSDGWPGGVTVYPPNKTSETTDLYTLGDDDSDYSDSDDEEVAYIGTYSLKTSVGSDAQLKTSVVQENMDNLQVHLERIKNMRANISVTNFKYRSSYERSLSPRVCSLLQSFFESNGWFFLIKKLLHSGVYKYM